MSDNNSWILHDVIIQKSIPLEKAKQIAQKFISPTKHYYRETSNSYRFRNISKQKFKQFRAKPINEHITLIYGLLK